MVDYAAYICFERAIKPLSFYNVNKKNDTGSIRFGNKAVFDMWKRDIAIPGFENIHAKLSRNEYGDINRIEAHRVIDVFIHDLKSDPCSYNHKNFNILRRNIEQYLQTTWHNLRLYLDIDKIINIYTIHTPLVVAIAYAMVNYKSIEDFPIHELKPISLAIESFRNEKVPQLLYLADGYASVLPSSLDATSYHHHAACIRKAQEFLFLINTTTNSIRYSQILGKRITTTHHIDDGNDTSYCGTDDTDTITDLESAMTHLAFSGPNTRRPRSIA